MLKPCSERLKKTKYENNSRRLPELRNDALKQKFFFFCLISHTEIFLKVFFQKSILMIQVYLGCPTRYSC